MKKKLLILLTVLTILAVFSSCTKEKTVEEKVIGTWKVMEFETPDIQRTSVYAFDPNLKMVLTLNKDKSAVSILGENEQNCEWSFTEPDVIKIVRDGDIAVGTFRFKDDELLLESPNITMFLLRQ